MIELHISKSGSLLLYGGAALLFVIVLWPVFMVISQFDGTIEEQLLSLSTGSSLYQINFFIASLIAPVFLFVMYVLAFFVETGKQTPVLNILGAAFLIPYLILVSISYTSQYVILPTLIEAHNLETARLWLFDNPESIVYYLNQLGYLFLAIAMCSIGWKYLFEKGLFKFTGILLWSSGILSVIAFAGLALGSSAINAATFLSGILILPFAIIVVFIGRRMRHETILLFQRN
jgi:hypothetical protein